MERSLNCSIHFKRAEQLKENTTYYINKNEWLWHDLKIGRDQTDRIRVAKQRLRYDFE